MVVPVAINCNAIARRRLDELHNSFSHKTLEYNKRSYGLLTSLFRFKMSRTHRAGIGVLTHVAQTILRCRRFVRL
jgi:hypothetical protein